MATRREYSTYDFIASDIRHFQPQTSDERVHFQEEIASANRRGKITNTQAEELLHLMSNLQGPFKPERRAGKPTRRVKAHKRRAVGGLRRVAAKRKGHGVMRASSRGTVSVSGYEQKVHALLSGQRVVVGDGEMSKLENDERVYRQLRSVPNPRQVGTKDKWLAYL